MNNPINPIPESVDSFFCSENIGFNGSAFTVLFFNRYKITLCAHLKPAWLTCPITNPLVTEVHAVILAADQAMGNDPYEARFIKDFRKREGKA